jgi:rhodanese-related sulfurtransferase
MDVPEIDARTLKQRLTSDAEQPVLLDVREPYEYAEGVIPGAVFIPMNDIPARIDELDRDAEIVVYCAHGVRSWQVAAYLLYNGFTNVKSLADGFAAWAYHARYGK